jgi:aminoglycoside phosphotransferase (APT) family kinase protein
VPVTRQEHAAPSGRPGTPRAAVLDAVHTALQRDLADSGGDADSYAHLLGVADVVLHRAVLEDLREVRRGSASRLGRLVDELAPDSVGLAAPSPHARVEAAAERIAGGSVAPRLTERILRELVASDLPELGRVSTPEREAAATAAMDWLGRDAPATVTVPATAAYLAARSPSGGGPAVRSVRQLSGGFSKTTLLVAVAGAAGPEEIVLRQVPPGRDASTLAAEYEVVRFAWENGVAAPEPLWLEPDDNALGGPFFATRRVPGSNLGDVFGPRPGTGPEAAIGLAQALAHLHRLDPRDVPATPVAAMVSAEEIVTGVRQQEEQVALAARVDGDVPHPLHALLFAWLRTHAPGDVPRPVLLHGDPGFHNMLVDGGKVQALLDWERARVGDPAQDLAYVRPHVMRVQPWEEFLAAYCDAGGEEPDEQRLRYYSVWHDAWRFAGAYRGRSRLLTRPRMLLEAVMGLLHAPRFLMSGLQTAYGVDL